MKKREKSLHPNDTLDIFDILLVRLVPFFCGNSKGEKKQLKPVFLIIPIFKIASRFSIDFKQSY